MKELTIQISDYLYEFYRKIGQQANVSTEQVVSDTLFKLAGELSLNAIHKKRRCERGRRVGRTESSAPTNLLHPICQAYFMAQHPLPLPLGEVAERSEDGEEEQ